jgi:diguanylate cyclase (GGDEF)-like protein
MKAFNPKNFLILVVDDVSKDLHVIETILNRGGYSTILASSAEQALEQLKTIAPDLILLDLLMPEMNGLQFCEKFKADSPNEDIPIIFITVSDEQDHLLTAFQLGAVDYIVKPFRALELLARVRNHLELKQIRDELRKALVKLEKLATTDSLTGIPNRRHLFKIAEQELSRLRRYAYPFSLLILDIDHFKHINDTYGHGVGDEVLKGMVEIVLKSLRKEDCLGRLGGEEFVVFLFHTPIQAATRAAERIRQAIAETPLEIESNRIEITVSIGIATYQPQDQTIETILRRADDALLQAKHQGRNRIVANVNSLDSSA